MKYKKMGRSGLLVSEVGLGTMMFGEQVSESDAIEIVESAIANGINLIDTADSYVDGRTEEIVGKALKSGRDSVVLATKVGLWKLGGVNDRGASRKHILREVEESLRRLGTDYIDLYYVHRPDYRTPIEETLRALDDLVRQGKVRYIACSNYRAFQLCDALWVSDVHNLARYECIQSPYNLITRGIEYELLPLCASKGVGITVYNPLAGGLLSGKHDPDRPPPEGTRFTTKRLGDIYTKRYWQPRYFEAVGQLKKVAENSDKKLPQFALAWVLSNVTVTSVISGVSSLQQLKENIGATELTLSPEELAACDEVWQRLSPVHYLYGR